MGEFARSTRKRAAETVTRLQGQEPEGDPILQLVSLLLGDEAGDVQIISQNPISTEEWLLWNQLAMDREEELVQAMTEVLETERLPLPTEEEPMRNWAAFLLQETLDRLRG